VYECKDDKRKNAFTTGNSVSSKKDWSCKMLRRRKGKIKKLCKRKDDARKFCQITCDSCFSKSPSLIPSSLSSVIPSFTNSPSSMPSSIPSEYVCKDDLEKKVNDFEGKDITCEELGDSKYDDDREDICDKRGIGNKICPVTCNACKKCPIITKYLSKCNTYMQGQNG